MDILDIFIGLVLIYFLYSLLASIIAEIIASWLGMRARILRQGIENILNDKKQNDFNFSNWIKDIFMVEDKNFPFTQAGKFYQEPTIKYLAKPGENSILSIRNKKPSYISSENFVITLLNMLSNKGRGISEWDKIKFAIETNANHFEPETHKMLTDMVKRSNDTFKDFVSVLQHHYEDTMDRIIGWYKRKIGHILFWLGLTLCITFNVDSIQIAKELENSEEKRMQMLALAEKVIADKPGIDTLRKKEDYDNDLKYKVEAERLVRNSVLQANHIVGLGWPEYTLYFKKPCDNCVNGIKKYNETKQKYKTLYATDSLIQLYSGQDSAESILKASLLLHDSLLQLLNISHFSGFKIDYIDNRETGYHVYFKSQPSFAQRIWLWLSSWEKFIGILITTLALTLGAQFWFDLLKKLVSLRSSGLKPEEQEAEKKKLESLSLNGDAITSKDPVEIAISENKGYWDSISQVLGYNVKVDESGKLYIEIIIDENDKIKIETRSPYPVTIANETYQVEVKTIFQPKGTLENSDFIYLGALYQPKSGSVGSFAGIVKNKRTKNPAILTCGHVARIENSSYFLDNTTSDVKFYNGRDWNTKIGVTSNIVMSSFCDGGLIDITNPDHGLNNLKPIETIRTDTLDPKEKYFLISLRNKKLELELYDVDHYEKLSVPNGKEISIKNLIVFKAKTYDDYSMGGDSGSLIVDGLGRAVGMHIGGNLTASTKFTYAIPFKDLMEILQFELT